MTLTDLGAREVALHISNGDFTAEAYFSALSENMPTLAPEEFKGRPLPAQPRDFSDDPHISPEEQRQLLLIGVAAYEAIFRDNGVVAIAAPTVPVLPQIRSPLGGLPVRLGLDGLPGSDTDILGLGTAIEIALGSPPSPKLS